MSGLSVGIDLGTTNSLAAVYTDDGDIVLVKDQSGNVLIPSAVSLTDEGTVLVGRGAKSRLVIAPDRSVAAFKRAIGTNKPFQMGRKSFTAIDLSALVLQEVHAAIKAQFDIPIESLVITVPAYFNSIQREQTLAAADLADLKVSRLINEPTAAALAYGLQDRDAESTFVVLDLGGGTFDVSILEMFDGVMEVRASSGDAFLGGEDFTQKTAVYMADKLGLKFADMAQIAQEKFLGSAELIKQSLSTQPEATATLDVNGAAQDITITRTQFEEICLNLTARLRKPIERCLYDAKLSIEEIDRVLLVGGSTRMPLVRSMASRLFKKLPERGMDPDQVVAMGAAVQAGLVQKNAALDDVVMTDVSPFSLGIASRNETQGGVIEGAFVPIIERNTTIPTSRMSHFSTVRDNQNEILVQVYQGEAPLAQDNMQLGALRIAVPRGPAGQEGIAVRFSYDVNGLLEVDVNVLSTNEAKSIVIEGGAKTSNETDRKASLKRLSALKFHPRETRENQDIIEEFNELFAMHLGDDRQYITALLATFMTALDTQDERKITKAREEAKQSIAAMRTSYVT